MHNLILFIMVAALLIPLLEFIIDHLLIIFGVAAVIGVFVFCCLHFGWPVTLGTIGSVVLAIGLGCWIYDFVTAAADWLRRRDTRS